MWVLVPKVYTCLVALSRLAASHGVIDIHLPRGQIYYLLINNLCLARTRVTQLKYKKCQLTIEVTDRMVGWRWAKRVLLCEIATVV